MSSECTRMLHLHKGKKRNVIGVQSNICIMSPTAAAFYCCLLLVLMDAVVSDLESRLIVPCCVFRKTHTASPIFKEV